MLYYKVEKTYAERQAEKVSKIEKFFNKSVVNIAKECNFPDYTILVLQDNEVELRSKHKDVYDNIMSCVYAADERRPMEYAKDLIIAWIFEAYVMENLKKQGLRVYRNGGDKDLSILSQKKVSTDSDFLVEGRRVELISNYTDYWKRNNCFELRDSKLQHLKDRKSLVLGVSTNYDYYLLINFNNRNVRSDYIESYKPFGGKPAQRVYITDDMKVKLDFKELADSIRKQVRL